MSRSAASAVADLQRAVRTVPDFPKPGIQFKDITPILDDPALVRKAVEALARPYEAQGVTKVIGIESRGFILGAMMAEHLGVGFVPVRKAGKLPFDTYTESYALEYGVDTLEIHTDALAASDRVLIHDDVIATGGTAAATGRLAEKAGGQVLGYAFLVELGALDGRAQLDRRFQIHAVLTL